MRPLEAAARKAGVADPARAQDDRDLSADVESGPVLGIAVDYHGTTLDIRARKAVIVAPEDRPVTSISAECSTRALPRSIAASPGCRGRTRTRAANSPPLAIGASVWGLYNQTSEFGSNVTKPGQIGCQYGYRNLQWMPRSAVFDRARAWA